MSDDIAIKVENLTKVYKLYDSPQDRLKESLHPLRKKYHHDFHALKHVSFEVKRGATVGIIGRNGSGKSTLLKIISGVLSPTSGTVTVNGKVSALLELGAGFNPELSGIENVYFSGTLMGYSREEMDARLDEILSFADIGEFVSQPVKTYSSGMFVRLAFAAATIIEPDTLIVDEALSVGDIRFQQKCFRKMNDFKENGKTILFVSHDLGAVKSFCDSSVWIHDGEIMMQGEVEPILKEYNSFMHYGSLSVSPEVNETHDNGYERDFEIEWEPSERCESFGEGGARIIRVGLINRENKQSVRLAQGGEHLVLMWEAEIVSDIASPIVGFVLNDKYGNHISGTNSCIAGRPLPSLRSGQKITAEFEYTLPLLQNGDYSFSVAIAEGTLDNHIQHHWVHDAYHIRISSADPAARLGWYMNFENMQISVKST